MSEGQSQRLVASSAQHRQEAEVAAAEERERATARVARLAMAELSAARAEVEAAATVDAARAAAAELEALRGSNTSSSVSVDGGTDDELKQAREVAREQAAVGNRATPGARWWLPRQARTRRRLGRRRSRPLQAVRLSLPGHVPWSSRDPSCCQKRRSRR
jgi:hypothetical protein